MAEKGKGERRGRREGLLTSEQFVENLLSKTTQVPVHISYYTTSRINV
jgi:hypothetical protein